MKVILKVKFNASNQRMEKFGSNRYLIYLPFGQDNGAEGILISLLSKYMGVPQGRIKFEEFDYNKDWVFDIA